MLLLRDLSWSLSPSQPLIATQGLLPCPWSWRSPAAPPCAPGTGLWLPAPAPSQPQQCPRVPKTSSVPCPRWLIPGQPHSDSAAVSLPHRQSLSPSWAHPWLEIPRQRARMEPGLVPAGFSLCHRSTQGSEHPYPALPAHTGCSHFQPSLHRHKN